MRLPPNNPKYSSPYSSIALNSNGMVIELVFPCTWLADVVYGLMLALIFNLGSNFTASHRLSQAT